jgi:hypothetical protein
MGGLIPKGVLFIYPKEWHMELVFKPWTPGEVDGDPENMALWVAILALNLAKCGDDIQTPVLVGAKRKFAAASERIGTEAKRLRLDGATVPLDNKQFGLFEAALNKARRSETPDGAVIPGGSSEGLMRLDEIIAEAKAAAREAAKG